MYLYGVDTMKAPGEYLHSDNDISAAMSAKVGEAIDSKAAMLLLAVATSGRRNA
jgi:hypothetical protein